MLNEIIRLKQPLGSEAIRVICSLPEFRGLRKLKKNLGRLGCSRPHAHDKAKSAP
ncbi:unnamed protein product [Ixodes pacificus]